MASGGAFSCHEPNQVSGICCVEVTLTAAGDRRWALTAVPRTSTPMQLAASRVLAPGASIITDNLSSEQRDLPAVTGL